MLMLQNNFIPILFTSYHNLTVIHFNCLIFLTVYFDSYSKDLGYSTLLELSIYDFGLLNIKVN